MRHGVVAGIAVVVVDLPVAMEGRCDSLVKMEVIARHGSLSAAAALMRPLAVDWVQNTN